MKWQVINDIIAKNSKPNKLKELINNINNNTDSNSEKPEYILANQFNNYFINQASDLVI